MQDAGKISAIYKKKSGAAGIAAPEGKTRSLQKFSNTPEITFETCP